MLKKLKLKTLFETKSKFRLKSLLPRTEERDITKPPWYSDYVDFTLPIVINEIPSNFEEAIESEENEKWCNTMDDEMNSLSKNKT